MKKHTLLRFVRVTIEWLTFVGIVALVAVFSLTADLLPIPQQPVPATHGLVSSYGIRYVLLLLFVIACCAIAFFFLLSRFQRLYKYPFEITAKNIEPQYQLAKIMLGVSQLICSTYFCVIMVFVYQQRIEFGDNLFLIYTLFAFIALAVNYIIYLVAAYINK